MAKQLPHSVEPSVWFHQTAQTNYPHQVRRVLHPIKHRKVLG